MVEAIDLTIYQEPTLTLPTCLQYTNPQGQAVSQLIHNQYSQTLAVKICEIKGLVDTHTTQISGLNNRVVVLENITPDAFPQVSVACITGNNALVDLDDAITSVATDLCSLRGVVGTNTAITAAAAKQCSQLGSLPALSSTGTMSNLTGWKTNVTTLSDSIYNLWLTVCDIRGAIGGLKETVGTVDCSSVIVDFVASLNSQRDSLTINFNGLTTIPVGFAECSQLGSKLTVTDTAGNKYNGYVAVVANKNNSSGVTISLIGSALDTALNYTVELESCVVKEGKSCTKNIVKTLYTACTNITINSVTIN